MKSIIALFGAGVFGFAYFGKLIDAYDDGVTWDDVKQATLYAVLCTGASICLAVVIWAVVLAMLSAGGVGE